MRSIKAWARYLLVALVFVALLALSGCDGLPFGDSQSSGDGHVHALISHNAKEPTCTESGWSAYYTCANCTEYTTFEELPALGHSYYTDGFIPYGDVHSRFCSRCPESLSESHDWQAVSITAPTCIDPGKEDLVCSVCSSEKTVTLAMLGHDFSGKCETSSDGHDRFCVRCDESILQKHDWQLTDVKDPTCEQKGVKSYSCSDCGATRELETDSLGHNYSGDFNPGGDNHSVSCDRCSFELSGAHEWREGETVDPTCTAYGTHKYMCILCNVEKSENIDPLGHDMMDEYEYDEDTHTQSCSRCSLKLVASHSFEMYGDEMAPTCVDEGSQDYKCDTCGMIKTEAIAPTGVHLDKHWVTVQAASDLYAGLEELRCKVCDAAIEQRQISAAIESMPVIYLNGNYWEATAKKNEVEMTVSYVDPDGEKSFDGYATIKVQGASSTAYDKKNYTIKFFKDDTYNKKQKVDLGWGSESKYVMKANWVDYTQARNIISCRLWADMVSSRPDSATKTKLLSLSTNAGAIDGYGIAVYMNGEFYGLYTMNVPKDEWMFGMDDSETEALLAADDWNNTNFSVLLDEFVELPNGDIVCNKSGNDYGWELRYCGTDDYSWVTESFNNLILFCQNNDGADFKEGISQHLDVDAAIDYLLYVYVIYMRDNHSKNMLWATYDGNVWIPSVYDQDGTFGQVWDGVRVAEVNKCLPSIRDGKVYDGFNYGPTDPYFVLWDRLWNNFTAEIIARYYELRASVLNTEYITAEFEAFRAEIPEFVYVADREKWAESREAWWTSKNGDKNTTWYDKYNYEYIYSWQAERFYYLDNAIASIQSYYGL